MTKHDKQSKFETLDRKFRERQEQSRRFLEDIDHLEAEIATNTEQAVRNKLQREIDDTRRQFAEHLGDLNYIHPPSLRTVTRVWLVSRICSKKHKDKAKEWMKARGVDWNGSTPALRHQIRTALERGEPVPDGKFGLHVERSVDIKPPRTIIVNESGKPRQVIVPLSDTTNAENKAEKDFLKFVRARISHK
jgi:hypothetical protein